jgi:hypothetical protein
MPARFQVADHGAQQDVVATPQEIAQEHAQPTPIIEGVLADDEVAAMLDPELRIGSLRGISAEQAGVMFAPVTESLEACRPNKRARLRVRIVADENGTTMHLDPKSRIDPKTKRCVLEALSIMEVEGALAQSATSASDAPPRIESQLTINW